MLEVANLNSKTDTGAAKFRIGFCLLPEFSSLAFISAVEPLRLANRLNGEKLYSWECYSIDGKPAVSSAGIEFSVQGGISDMPTLPTVFTCGGVNIQNHTNTQILSNLRRLSSHGSSLGAICTGSHVLAKAGLLKGYRCTIHWENLSGFIEDFPDLDITSELFEIDRNRYTC